MATEIDAFEKEHYRRLLNELNILVKHKAEKAAKMAEKQVKVIELDEWLKYPPENPPNFKRFLSHINEQNDFPINRTGNKSNTKLLKMPKEFDKLEVLSDDKHTTQVFKYKGWNLEKHSEYDMFYVRSIVDNLNQYSINEQIVRNFIHSYSFYVQLTLLDDRLPKYGNVYLLIDKDTKTCKVGMSWNIEQRYSLKKLQKELVYVVPVNNMKVVESKLITRFKEVFGDPVKGNETFAYKNMDDVKDEFKAIVANEEIIIDIYKDIPHHITKFKTPHNKTNNWCSFDAMRVLFNYYVEKENDRNNVRDFISLINYAIERDSYIYTTYNNKLKTEVEYILFHKYRLLKNKKDDYVNGSVLYNSIRKADNTKLKYRRFKEYMNSDRFQRRIQQLKTVLPDEKGWYQDVNVEQPYLSGYYIHYSLVHFILDDLDANYAIHTSILIFRLYTDTKLFNKLPMGQQIIKAISLLASDVEDDSLIHLLPIINGGSTETSNFNFILIVLLLVIVIIIVTITVVYCCRIMKRKYKKTNISSTYFL